jgi:hypothetical protein
VSSTSDATVRGGEPTLQRRILIGVILLGAAILLYFIVKAIVPRWWAQRVGDVVDGSLTVGALFGVFVGFVFVAIPLLTAWAVIRWRPQHRTWQAWLGWIVVVAVLAAPNLMTLNIVIGNGNGEHAGDRTLDTEAPGFRVWSVIGAIAGIAVVGWMVYLARSRRASRQRVAKLRDEIDTRPTRDGSNQ